MRIAITPNGTLGHASAQLLSNNIEAYQDTVPSLLSDRLRNPKFAGPENTQTGVAAEWEPIGNGMGDLACRLVPGMYLSGRESQRIHAFAQSGWAGIVQAGVRVAAGEEFEVELWLRAQHRPVPLRIELRLPGQAAPDASKAELLIDQGHWHRRTCRLRSPGSGGTAAFCLTIGGDSQLILDQVHLRPVGEGHVSPAVAAALDGLPCPVLRFPGGCASCGYHWEHSVGPVHLRPVCDDPVFKYKMHYDFGTDEYLELCAARNIRPFITLNTTTATPEQAAAWAAYVRAWHVARRLPVPAAYVMFGNENYGTWELGHFTGEMYAAQLHAFVPGVRAAYPEARIIAIGEFESGGLREGHGGPWRSTVMAKAAGLFDLLAVTRYTGAPDNLPLAETMQKLVGNLAEKEADLARQAQTIREAGLACRIGIVEWNYWTRASHHDHAGFFEPNDIRHCLYAAGFLNALCRLGDLVELANFYSLFNTMGMVHIHDGQVLRSDLVEVFRLYAEALPGEVLAVAATGAELNVNVLRREGRTFAFLVNYGSAAVEADCAGLGRIAEATGLSARAILEPVTAFQPVVAGTVVTLPPMSLVRVRCT